MTIQRKMRIWSLVNILWAVATVAVIIPLWEYEENYLVAFLESVEDEAVRKGTAMGGLIVTLFDFMLSCVVIGEGLFRLFPTIRGLKRTSNEDRRFYLVWGGIGKIVCSVVLGIGCGMAMAPLTKWVKGIFAALLLLGGGADFFFRRKIPKENPKAEEALS